MTEQQAEEVHAQGSEPQAPGLIGEGYLQADDSSDDRDSTYNDSEASSYMTSLSSSIVDYTYENGRRYHAFRAGAYLMPNDQDEQDRMDLLHHVYRLLLGGKLHLAPIGETPQRVLDLGTGTGIWAMDFADEYPSAEVLGIDLSPIQPKWTPPNCIFEVDDFEEEWVYRKPFDFIHGRELEGCIAKDDKLFQRAFEHLNPGGYIEMQATSTIFASDDGTLERAKEVKFWLDTLLEGTSRFGKPLDIAPRWKGKLEAAGFVDVQEKILKLPVGTWPKDPKLKQLGSYQLFQQLQGVDSYTPAIAARVLGWNDLEIEALMARVKRDFKDSSNHLYLPIHFVWGKKP